MSELSALLDIYAPPPIPKDLAVRAASAASALPQSRRRGVLPWRRGAARGSWKRPLLIGTTVIGVAFTSAVAATVASGGRIDIPVVTQVAAAVPMFGLDQRPERAPRPVRTAKVAVPRPKVAPPVPPAPTAQPAAAAWRGKVMQRLAAMKQQVEQRRIAGLPTPRADRIERQARQIVEKRQAAGMPVPPLEQVEARLAMRELRAQRLLKRIPDDPAAISDQQVVQFSRLLPPQRRQRFLALSPAMQRQAMKRMIERLRARRTPPLDAPGDPGRSSPIPEASADSNGSSEGFAAPAR